MIFRNRLGPALVLALFSLFFPLVAMAGPDATLTDSVIVDDPFGTYQATKTIEVYAPANASNPCPGPTAGNFCYVYTVANSSGSSIGLIGFEVGVAPGSVTAAGFIAGTGVAPSATNIETSAAGVVDWDFFTTAIAPGAVSEQLFIESTLGPVAQPATVNGDFGLDAPTFCLGPSEIVDEPLPCTIGFWKNRSLGKNGLLQFFPDPDFANLVNDAVALSGGLFADAADLLANLQSKGNRTTLERAKQQLAATLLNLAAGDAFPLNQKCKLFEGNSISVAGNACGSNIFVGAAVSQSLTDASGTDTAAHHDAMECSDDLNNGIAIDDVSGGS